jgi:hypothetical protein
VQHATATKYHVNVTIMRLLLFELGFHKETHLKCNESLGFPPRCPPRNIDVTKGNKAIPVSLPSFFLFRGGSEKA